MFKQRKVKGSLKRKVVESESESEQEDEEEVVEDVNVDNKKKTDKKGKKKGKKVGVSMSFAEDEGDGGDMEMFKVKKSKLSRTIKRKMRQAPPPIADQERLSSAYHMSSTTSADYLSTLRAEQKYFTPQADPQTIGGLEGLELTGEEAESMEELTDAMTQRKFQDADDGSGNSEVIEGMQLPDYVPLVNSQHHYNDKNEKKVALQSSLQQTESRRILQQQLVQDVFNDDNDPTSKDWEDQLAKRAGIDVSTRPKVSSNNLPQGFDKGEKTDVLSKVDREKMLDTLSYATVKRTLHNQISMLTDRTELASSRLRSLESTLSNHRAEVEELRESSNKMDSQMEFLKNLRLFASDVCGMLREKELFIKELQDAVLHHLQVKTSSWYSSWKRRQDYMLDKMYQEGDIVTLGGYLPAQVTVAPSGSFPTLNEECKEMQSAEKALQDTMQTFQDAANTLMQDVRHDLSSLSSVLSFFQEFRRHHLKKYRDAYISISLSQILKHYVMLDILPIYLLDGNDMNQFSIRKRSWFKPLFSFSVEDVSFNESSSQKIHHKNTNGWHAEESDSDSSLLPRVVSEIVLPWFTEVINFSLNPLSTTQMSICRSILEEMRKFDLREEHVAPICLSILNTASKWLGSICVPVIKIHNDHPEDVAKQRTHISWSPQFFVRQQLDRLSLILQNLRMFCDVIAASDLAILAWTVLLNQGKAAMIKILSKNRAPGDTEGDEVENYASSARLCKAIAALLPSQDKLNRNYDDMNIPETNVHALSSVIFFSQEAVASQNKISSTNFGFHKAALLQFLRQLPSY